MRIPYQEICRYIRIAPYSHLGPIRYGESGSNCGLPLGSAEIPESEEVGTNLRLRSWQVPSPESAPTVVTFQGLVSALASKPEFYLKANVVAEPLVDGWYAWSHLIPPATFSRNLTERHLKIIDSYLESRAEEKPVAPLGGIELRAGFGNG